MQQLGRQKKEGIKALAAGATACSFGKAFLFSLGAGGERGVEKLLENGDRWESQLAKNLEADAPYS